MIKKKVKIEIDEEDMNAIEDVFFCELTNREYKNIVHLHMAQKDNSLNTRQSDY